MHGNLYLVPNTLGNPDTSLVLPPVIIHIVKNTPVFIVENLRNARRFLKSLDKSIVIDELKFHELNEHTPYEDIPGFLMEVLHGQNTAIISEAGVPGVADPGAQVVRIAHEKGIRVIPFSGPSSIVMSIMASGLNGQSFRFHGYLPVKSPDRVKKIRAMEQEIFLNGETQAFIEAPYRNDALLSDILANCSPATRLCIAADITMDSEFIRTRPVAEWKRSIPKLHKRPVVFLLGS